MLTGILKNVDMPGLYMSYTLKCYSVIFSLTNFKVKHTEMGPFDMSFTLLPEFKIIHAVNVYWIPNYVLDIGWQKKGGCWR